MPALSGEQKEEVSKIAEDSASKITRKSFAEDVIRASMVGVLAPFFTTLLIASFLIIYSKLQDGSLINQLGGITHTELDQRIANLQKNIDSKYEPSARLLYRGGLLISVSNVAHVDEENNWITVNVNISNARSDADFIISTFQSAIIAKDLPSDFNTTAYNIAECKFEHKTLYECGHDKDQSWKTIRAGETVSAQLQRGFERNINVNSIDLDFFGIIRRQDKLLPLIPPRLCIDAIEVRVSA